MLDKRRLSLYPFFYKCKYLHLFYCPNCSIWSNSKIKIIVDFFFLCDSKVDNWLILSIISKWKCSPVYGESSFYIEFILELEGFFWIGMYISHEPSRLVCSDREESNIESIREVFSNHIDECSISSISCEIESFTMDIDHESSPECSIPIIDSTGREVLRGDKCYVRLTVRMEYMCIPPIHIDNIANPIS